MVEFFFNALVVQLLSCTMPWTIAHQVPLSPIISQSLLRFMFIESVMNMTSNLTILSSAIPFCFCLKYFPASGTFPVSWLFALQMGFGSSTIHEEQPQVRRVRGSGPRDCPPFRCHSQVQAVTCASDPLGTNWRFP